MSHQMINTSVLRVERSIEELSDHEGPVRVVVDGRVGCFPTANVR
jgi:hypothetical protein